jgi:hypothetical protein
MRRRKEAGPGRATALALVVGVSGCAPGAVTTPAPVSDIAAFRNAAPAGEAPALPPVS